MPTRAREPCSSGWKMKAKSSPGLRGGESSAKGQPLVIQLKELRVWRSRMTDGALLFFEVLGTYQSSWSSFESKRSSRAQRLGQADPSTFFTGVSPVVKRSRRLRSDPFHLRFCCVLRLKEGIESQRGVGMEQISAYKSYKACRSVACGH